MKNFSFYLEKLNEFGVVQNVTPPIATIVGLPHATLQELVIFETGELGQVFAIHENSIDVLVFSSEPVRVETKLTRTNKTLTVPVGKELLGKLIDPLGTPLLTMANIVATEERAIDISPTGIAKRARITQQFHTGTILVDMMVPLGKGQKELIIGDRKTGKSSFLLTTIKAQVAEGSIAVYCAIGRKKSDIAYLQERIAKEGIMQNIVIVATGSNDSPSLIYLTPFTAMTIAEYFRDQGINVLIVLDDLSTHAKFYREIALLAKSFPGRDSYPGDIFYTHARLLERAGNFFHEQKGSVAITCLPIVETVEGDLTGYIPTNLMGITDGHIFFDSNIFYKGRRPAINTALSVTRVGKQTQTRVKRDITRELNAFFALFEKMQNLSHFGAELTENVKSILRTGEKMYRFFDQHYSVVVPDQIQIILFCLLWLNLIIPDVKTITTIRMTMIEEMKKKETQLLFDEILEGQSLNDVLHNVSINKERLFTLWKKNVV